MMRILCLSFDFLPTVLPSVTSFNKLSPPHNTICPILFPLQYCCLYNTFPVTYPDLYFFTRDSSSYAVYSLLKAFHLSTTSFFIVHVSERFRTFQNATGHTNVLTILFLKPFVKSLLTLLNATAAIAILT